MAKREKEEVRKGMEDIFASSNVDLVSQVIASDRRRTGRGEKKPKKYDNMTSPNVIKQYDNKTDNKVVRQAIKEESGNAITQSRVEAPSKTQKQGKAKASEVLSARIEEAAKMAGSPTITVTLRIPQELNAWLDGYVHGAWPKVRVKKQELVVEGLRLLIARRGRPGEEVIQTELLPEEGT